MASTKNFTVTSASSEYGNTFKLTCDGSNVDVPGEKGIGLIVYEKDSKNPSVKKMFDCSDSSHASNLCTNLEKIRDGSIVIMGLKGDGAKHLTQECKRAIASLGSVEINKLTPRDSWAMILKKGSPQHRQEYRKQDLVTFNYSL